MMRALLVIAAAAASPADASDRVDGLDKASIRATEVLNDFGRCVARNRSGSVRKLIAAQPGSSAETSALLEAARTGVDCDLSGAGAIRVSKGLLRGSILEAYYHQTLANSSAPLRPSMRTPAFNKAAEYDTEKARQDAVLRDLGSCIAASEPAGIIRLLRTTPLSREEARASEAMTSSLQTCAPKDLRVEITQQELRAYLAFGLTHRLLVEESPILDARLN